MINFTEEVEVVIQEQKPITNVDKLISALNIEPLNLDNIEVKILYLCLCRKKERDVCQILRDSYTLSRDGRRTLSVTDLTTAYIQHSYGKYRYAEIAKASSRDMFCTALHEAGHALAAILIPENRESRLLRFVLVKTQEHYKGFCSWIERYPYAEERNAAILFLTGYVAEKLGNHQEFSVDELFARIGCRQDVEGFRSFLMESREKLTHVEFKSLLEGYLEDTACFLRKNYTILIYLAGILMEKKFLFANEIYDVVNSISKMENMQLSSYLCQPEIEDLSSEDEVEETTVYSRIVCSHQAIHDILALPDCLGFFKVNDSFGTFEGKCILMGDITPQHGPWKNSPFEIELSFPNQYPFLYPSLRVTNICFHPSVLYRDGTMYVRGIQGEDFYGMMREVEAEKGNGVERILKCILEVLENPEEESVLCMDAWELYSKNPRRCEELVQKIQSIDSYVLFEDQMYEYYRNTLHITPPKTLRDIYLPYHIQEANDMNIRGVKIIPSAEKHKYLISVTSLQGPYKRANLSFLFEPSPNYPDAKMNVGELSLHSSMNHLLHPCIAVTNDHRVILKTLDFPAIHRSFLNKNAAFHGRRMNKNWIVVILTELSRLFNTLSVEELFINEKHVYPFYRGLIRPDSIFHPSMLQALIEYSLDWFVHPMKQKDLLPVVLKTIEMCQDTLQKKFNTHPTNQVYVTYRPSGLSQTPGKIFFDFREQKKSQIVQGPSDQATATEATDSSQEKSRQATETKEEEKKNENNNGNKRERRDDSMEEDQGTLPLPPPPPDTKTTPSLPSPSKRIRKRLTNQISIR